ncbi:hypothetical protein [Rhodococcus ruber]
MFELDEAFDRIGELLTWLGDLIGVPNLSSLLDDDEMRADIALAMRAA